MGKSLITLGFSIFFSTIILFSVFAQPPEQITITTYYPSPFGSYRELRASRMTVHPTRAMPAADGELYWGAQEGRLLTNSGASIRLGGSGTPYIDFYNQIGGAFDARIILLSNNRLAIDGVTVRSFDGRTSPGSIPAPQGSRAHIPGCIRFTFNWNSGTQHCPSSYNIVAGPMRPENSWGQSDRNGVFLCCQTQ